MKDKIDFSKYYSKEALQYIDGELFMLTFCLLIDGNVNRLLDNIRELDERQVIEEYELDPNKNVEEQLFYYEIDYILLKNGKYLIIH